MVFGEWYKIKLIEIDIKWFFYGIINVVLFFILLYLDIQICLLVYRKGFHIELLFIIILCVIYLRMWEMNVKARIFVEFQAYYSMILC